LRVILPGSGWRLSEDGREWTPPYTDVTGDLLSTSW
jgi:hypothetical protein